MSKLNTRLLCFYKKSEKSERMAQNSFSTIFLDNPFNLIEDSDLKILTRNISNIPKYELTIFFKFFLNKNIPLMDLTDYSQLATVLRDFQVTNLLLEFLDYRKLCFSRCYTYAGFFKIFYTFTPLPTANSDLAKYISENESNYSQICKQTSKLIKKFETSYPELSEATPRTKYHMELENLKSEIQIMR